jgi:hypothetical protein
LDSRFAGIDDVLAGPPPWTSRLILSCRLVLSEK